MSDEGDGEKEIAAFLALLKLRGAVGVAAVLEECRIELQGGETLRVMHEDPGMVDFVRKRSKLLTDCARWWFGPTLVLEIVRAPLEEPTIETWREADNHRTTQPENDAGSASDEDSPISLFLHRLRQLSPITTAILREEGKVDREGDVLRVRVPAGAAADCMRDNLELIEEAAERSWSD